MFKYSYIKNEAPQLMVFTKDNKIQKFVFVEDEKDLNDTLDYIEHYKKTHLWQKECERQLTCYADTYMIGGIYDSFSNFKPIEKHISTRKRGSIKLLEDKYGIKRIGFDSAMFTIAYIAQQPSMYSTPGPLDALKTTYYKAVKFRLNGAYIDWSSRYDLNKRAPGEKSGTRIVLRDKTIIIKKHSDKEPINDDFHVDNSPYKETVLATNMYIPVAQYNSFDEVPWKSKAITQEEYNILFSDFEM